MRTIYPRSDSLRIWYKVSSEPNYDYLEFMLNGNEVMKISGETEWKRKSVEIPAGFNMMEWIYKKDNSVSQGADYAQIDLIDFSETAPVKYIEKDIELLRMTSPVQKE